MFKDNFKLLVLQGQGFQVLLELVRGIQVLLELARGIQVLRGFLQVVLVLLGSLQEQDFQALLVQEIQALLGFLQFAPRLHFLNIEKGLVVDENEILEDIMIVFKLK